MKTGIIFYITEGKEHVSDHEEMIHDPGLYGADAVSVANSEFEISYAWWRMLTRGIQQISCRTARLDGTDGSIHGMGRSLRIWG